MGWRTDVSIPRPRKKRGSDMAKLPSTTLPKRASGAGGGLPKPKKGKRSVLGLPRK